MKKEAEALEGAGQEIRKEYAVETLKEAVSAVWRGERDLASHLEHMLWNTLCLLEGTLFYTAKGLDFSYTIRGNEMFVTRKDKSITYATVILTFHRAMELKGIVTGPKKLGTFGASYLYPIFLRIGVIQSL